MEQSILKSTKKMLQIGDDDTSFDLDIITHINTAFSTLHDLGVGPEAGFSIEDDTVNWEDFLSGDVPQLSRIKVFVFLATRMLFDPPPTAHMLAAMEKQVEQALWRISVNRESLDWVDPDPVVVVEE